MKNCPLRGNFTALNLGLKSFLGAIFLLFFGYANGVAQSTFTEIYHILQNNCATAGCHDGSSQRYFDATLSEAAVYNSLVGFLPGNTNALAKGDRLVTPGYPARSFLLRKIARGISTPLVIDANEGDYMPSDAPLADHEIELVRQWILRGAPLTGNVVDTALINTYYRDGGIDDTYPTHAPPPRGQGFQVYLGKIFVPPHTEYEYYCKYDLRVSGDIEVNKYTALMPASGHHFVFSRFLSSAQAALYPEGLRPESVSSHTDTEEGIGVGAGLWEEELPQGTAYLWNSPILDLNLHILNNHSVVLGTDLYLNIYTQPLGTAQEYMRTRNFPNEDIIIPNGGATYDYTAVARDTAETRYWNIWMLYSHTHQLGTDYDIWLRNEDGSKAAQVYEGFYNQDYTFNQGFYGWGVDVPIRRFAPPYLVVDPRLGFIHTAKYVNRTPFIVYEGPNSTDEMMVMGFQYFYGDTLGAIDTTVTDTTVTDTTVVIDTTTNIVDLPAENYFRFFPNPAESEFMINYVLQNASEVSLELTNILGQTFTIFKQTKPAGNFLETVELGDAYRRGVYLLTFRTEEKVVTKRVVLQ